MRTLQEHFSRLTPRRGVEKMVELPQGDVTEVRRGDRDALRILSSDMTKLATTGFIRTERKPKDAMPRVGHILFLEGHPTLAIHEGDAIVFGLEALLEIEDDAVPMEALLAVHELPTNEAQRVAALHTNAFLHLETVDRATDQEERWWSNVQLRPGSWRREERLPELEVVVEAPEAVRQRSRAYMQRYEGLERMIHPGDALLFDALDPAHLFTLAGHLANHGRPILVISRHDPDSLNVEHNLPAAACHWLSTSDHPRAIPPSLEQVRTKIDAFLWENMRAVVLLEGIEYLAGVNGDGRTIDFIRDVVDGVRMDDHVLLSTADMNAFELEPRHRMSRCLTLIEPFEIEHWLTEPELILDHPLCAPPTEEEGQWIEQQLQRGLEHSPTQTSTPYDGGGMVGGHEPADEFERQEATAMLESQVRSWAEPEPTAKAPPTQEAEVVEPTLIEPHIEATVAPSQAQASEPISVQTNAAPIATVATSESRIQASKKPTKTGPRPALRQRRRKRREAKAPSNQQAQTVAAAAHAPRETPLFPAPNPAHKPAAIATTLDAYEARQQTAIAKTFRPQTASIRGLRDALRQRSSARPHQLPPVGAGPRPLAAIEHLQPIGATTPLTPLSARPGIETEAKPKHLPREISSKEQTAPSIEDTLSSWELEDLERVRKERDGVE